MLAPYTAHLPSKAPWEPNLSNSADTDPLSTEYLAEERTNAASCGGNFLDLKIGDSGVIESPNYPEDYPPNAECTWWLKVDSYEAYSQGKIIGIIKAFKNINDRFLHFVIYFSIYLLQSEEIGRIAISCDSLTTQSCEDEKYFDFVLLSPSWEWKTFVV